MQKKTIHRAAGLALGILVSTAAPAGGVEGEDPRVRLGFTEAEQAVFLADMRDMLGSVQGIMQGIAEEDRELIAEAAKRSGNRMSRNTPASIRGKLPEAFKEIGGPTHLLFEEIAIRAETDPMSGLTALTARTLQQCMACHARFRVD